MTRVVFMGTPEAAVPTLRSLADRHDVVLVITQPDRPRGRSALPRPPPVKVEALSRGLEVRQPARSSEIPSILGTVDGLDLAVVVAYGRLLKPDALAIPSHGVLNVHFSLLPRWRGAAPVARALMAGDPMTGVTIIALDEGLDTGPVLTAQAIDILADETAGDLTPRLAELGARLLTSALPSYIDSTLVPVPQSDEGATYAARIEPSDRPLDVAGPARAAVDRVRGLSPEPGATLSIDGAVHQILRARLHEESPGHRIWALIGGVPVAGFGDEGVELVELQPPGKRPMSGLAWASGRRRSSGSVR